MIENPAEFTAFLCRAKLATYAGKGPTTPSSRPASHDLHYREHLPGGEYLYIDTYLGGFRFAGEEAVWKDGAPVWGMNYYGWMLVPAIPEGFGDFLKEALRQVPASAPYRGPKEWQNGRYAYACDWEGALEGFYGQEWIMLGGEPVYRLLFHGGIILP
ncbi:MAG TPA: DUF5680 domain-containing protein [Anaerolineaceae bacterium]